MALQPFPAPEDADKFRQDLQDKLNRSDTETTRRDGDRSASPCPTCEGTGFIRVRREDGAWGVTSCQCARDRAIQQKLAVVPNRFRDRTFAMYEPVNPKQEKALQIILRDFTKSFYLYGPVGHGKTHLLYAQYMELVRIERSCMALSMAELIMELRRAELDSEYFCRLRDRVRYADRFHLFLDDIDKFKATEFKFESLFDLFDTLYKRSLHLTATGNLSIDELMDSGRLHPAIVRRIEDTCQVLEV